MIRRGISFNKGRFLGREGTVLGYDYLVQSFKHRQGVKGISMTPPIAQNGVQSYLLCILWLFA